MFQLGAGKMEGVARQEFLVEGFDGFDAGQMIGFVCWRGWEGPGDPDAALTYDAV